MALRDCFRGWLRGGLLLAIGLAVGCGGENVGKPPPEGETHIRKMAGLWSAYRYNHGGKAPKSTEELTKWARSLSPAKLKDIGVDNLDDVLTSPRDHEPYQVLPKPPMNRMGIASVVVYEKTGVNGKHLTAGTRGNVGTLTDAELRDLGANT